MPLRNRPRGRRAPSAERFTGRPAGVGAAIAGGVVGGVLGVVAGIVGLRFLWRHPYWG